MAEPVSTSVYLIWAAIAASAVSGAVSIENAGDAAHAQKVAAEAAAARAEGRRLAERRRVLRETRIRQASIIQAAEARGVSGSSSAQSGVDVTGSNFAAFSGRQIGERNLGQSIAAAQNASARSSFRATRARLLGNIASSALLGAARYFPDKPDITEIPPTKNPLKGYFP